MDDIPQPWPGDLRTLERHLANLERAIVDGELCVSRQVAVVERRKRGGLPTDEAEAVLADFENTIARWVNLRQLIIEHIASRDGSSGIDEAAAQAQEDTFENHGGRDGSRQGDRQDSPPDSGVE